MATERENRKRLIRNDKQVAVDDERIVPTWEDFYEGNCEREARILPAGTEGS